VGSFAFVEVAVASGEKISQKKGGTVVKGITMYGFSFSKTPDGYSARVAMDV
jgi:SHS2 domain-containing protein